MTDPAPGPEEGIRLDGSTPLGGRRKKGRRLSGCLPVLIALALVGGLVYFGVTRGVDVVRDQFTEAADFPGPGQGELTFEVKEGDSIAEIGRNLKSAGVVASVESFTVAAGANPDATGIQVGFYDLMKEMSAADALEVLVDPANIMTTTVTVPEGLRVEEIVDVLVKETEFGRGAYQRVLDNPDRLGLPDYAEGNPEGYLFPSTYGFGPNEKPESILQTMVQRWEQAATDADLEGAAEELGYTPHELMTIAAMVEAEARPDDMPKVARVIYNRLENPDNGITQGFLQIDATVNYALGQDAGVALTQEQLEVDSPYNTRRFPGLPPGPIGAPGDVAIAAAADPPDGDWLFYVTVDLKTGETKFTPDPDEFLEFKQEFLDYCETSDAC